MKGLKGRVGTLCTLPTRDTVKIGGDEPVVIWIVGVMLGTRKPDHHRVKEIKRQAFLCRHACCMPFLHQLGRSRQGEPGSLEQQGNGGSQHQQSITGTNNQSLADTSLHYPQLGS